MIHALNHKGGVFDFDTACFTAESDYVSAVGRLLQQAGEHAVYLWMNDLRSVLKPSAILINDELQIGGDIEDVSITIRRIFSHPRSLVVAAA